MPIASSGNVISSSAQLGADVVLTGAIKDGEIKNADISATAGIAITKISGGAGIVDGDINAGAAIQRSKLSGVAASGANNDITSLTALSTALPISEGGTGATDAGTAMSNLGGASQGYVDAVQIHGSVAVGDYLFARDDDVLTGGATDGAYHRLRRFICTRAGNYRVKCDWQASSASGGDGAKIKIYINGGAASGASSDIYQPYQTFSYDTGALSIGDVIEVWGESTALTQMTRNFRIYTDGSKIGGFIQS